jgi:hypothetical protein
VEIGEILDHVLVPRPNGSPALEQVATFIATRLGASGAEVTRHAFPATPHGLQLVWGAAFLLSLVYAVALVSRRYVLALVLAATWPLLLLAEFELLASPLSALVSTSLDNVVGTFPGQPGGPLLLFTAHYDTTTHFGDHLIWSAWQRWLGPTTLVAFVTPAVGLRRRRSGRLVSRTALGVGAAVVVAPVAGMTFFFAVGPMLRTPSPGALDNGGSVAALLRLGERLGARAAGPTSVRLVFLAAEEERALGSWHYAATLAREGHPRVAVINLEGIGTDQALTYVPVDGFALRRYRSPDALPGLLSDIATGAGRSPIEPHGLPAGTLTDGRSFLARGLPAVTLRGATPQGFPRDLHSWRDGRERLSAAAIESAAELLEAFVVHVDRQPHALDGL